MSRFLRMLGLSKAIKVSKGSAIAIARAECTRRGLEWREPVRVYRHYGNWSVWTHADHTGGNIRVIVDSGNGQVKAVDGPLSR